jgi:hypothetical protein
MPEIASALASSACKSVGAKLAARIPAPALNIKLRREIMPLLPLSVIACNSVQLFVFYSIISTTSCTLLLYFYFISSCRKILNLKF